MKTKTSKIFIILSVVFLIVCNSITVFASSVPAIAKYRIDYKAGNYPAYIEFVAYGTFTEIAIVKDDDGVYRLYAFADNTLQHLEGSQYFGGTYDTYCKFPNQTTYTYTGSKDTFTFTSSTASTASNPNVFHSIEECKSFFGIVEPPTEEPPTEEPPTEEPPTEEPPTEEPPTEEPPTEEPPTEEPPTEEPPTEEPPTEEPPTEEPPTEEPPTEEPPTENIDYGIAGNLVSDLIGNCKEFTPQSVMAIFVICLILECLSHIASAILSVGGMK